MTDIGVDRRQARDGVYNRPTAGIWWFISVTRRTCEISSIADDQRCETNSGGVTDDAEGNGTDVCRSGEVGGHYTERKYAEPLQTVP